MLNEERQGKEPVPKQPLCFGGIETDGGEWPSDGESPKEQQGASTNKVGKNDCRMGNESVHKRPLRDFSVLLMLG